MSAKRRSQNKGQQQHSIEASPATLTPTVGRGKRNANTHQLPTEKANASSSISGTEERAVDYLDDANISEDEEGGTRVGDIYIPPPIPPHCSTESKGPRLIIKKIENNNFKSYAGKVVLGPFHHCFTAIIGPNGSGKSNVIDSMLFVFGYRANKIRCKKISTLLHNSAKYPNMSMCTVAVHFRQILDRPDGTCEEVPDSDIIVERTAFRDNSSFYTINGKRVQFKEVAKLLKQHHVDLDHNRFLILQGEVESIAMMKPKGQSENESGMLEYLEDIVGTTRYKEPLVKINDRVEQLTEERTEKHNRCKLSEREMNDLEQPYNEAVEYLRRENENTRTKNLRIQKYLSEKNKKLEEYTKEHENVNQELKDHDDAATALRNQIDEKEKFVREETKQFDNLRKQKEKVEKSMETAKSNFMKVQQTMAVINKRRKENKVQVEKCEEDLIDLRKVPSKNEHEIKECEAKAEKLSKQKEQMENDLQKNYEQLESRTKPLIEKREKLETELIELQRHVDEAKAELTLSEQELKILKHDETTEARKYTSMKSSYEDSQKSLSEKQSAMTELKQRLPELQKEIATKTTQLKKLQLEEEQMNSKLMSLRAEINEKVMNMQANRSNNKVLDFLMRMKNEGKLPGILGRLGDLGGIDTKYDVAISTACGRLDNIVVDTVNTAQECIEHLKRYDVGRASFIALEKVTHLRNSSGPIQTPEQVPRLYDLVRVEDERILPAFYFALRNTLVAKDLEQGTRIAYGARRFRVVTLNGDLIETSGTMSGGGRTQLRGKMATKVQTKTKQSNDSSIVSQKALEDMQVQAEELQSKINYNQEQQGQLERELQQLNVNHQRSEAEVQKLTITIKSLNEQLPRIHKQLEAQHQRMEKTNTDATKVKRIEAEIEKKKKRFEKSEEAAGKVTEKINEIKSEIEAIHGDIIKAVQTKIKSLNTQINKLNGNVSKLKVEVTTSERNVVKMEKRIEDLHAEIIKAQNELTEMSKDRQKFDDETVALAKELVEAQAAIDNAKSQSSGILKEIQELQKAESDNKMNRVEIEQKVQTVAAKLNEVKSQIPHWRDQLKPLRLHEIPGETAPQTPLKTYTEEELATHTLQDIQYKESVQEELLKKKPNLSCIREYIEKRDVYLERVKVLEDITSRRNEMRQLYDDVRKKRYNEFMQGFHIITRKLKEMYQMITQGGDAEIELVDSMDPFTEGVSFSVRPPKKTWKNISNLSGGEKTLSSLALVFALHYYKPSPLYFMDEIDAALDFKNISIVAHYIKERTKNAQFIIISLRSNMFELSDYIVGIFKVKDCTDSVTIKNEPPPQPVTPTQQTQTAITASNDNANQNVIESPSPVKGKNNKNDNDNNENNPNPANESNIVPVDKQMSSHRDTTFLPQLESTTMSQAAQENTTQNHPDSEEHNSNSISDAFFKKPLPPPTTAGS